MKPKVKRLKTQKPKQMIEHNKKSNSPAKSLVAHASERSGTNKPLRINKFIAAAGVTSRRNADQVIKSGKVLVNGEKAKPGVIINPEKDKVIIAGKEIKPVSKFQYFAFYKPAGFITSTSDEQGESIQKYLPKDIRLFTVGRLDKETEGLLILTNDGDFANELAHPKFTKEKIYHLEYGGKPTTLGKEGIIRQFLKGIMHNGKRYYVDKAKFVGSNKLEVTLHQGRSRQLRIMAGKIGLEVINLKRVQVGKLKLSKLNLVPGKMVKITKEDIV